MDVPINNNLVQEGSDADNDSQVHMDTNLTLYAELLDNFFERRRKGKRKVADGSDGIGTQFVDADKKQKLSSDYEFSDECDIDLNLRLSTGTYVQSENQYYPRTYKNTTQEEDTAYLGFTGQSEHYASTSKEGPAISDLAIKPPDLGISQSQVLNQNKSKDCVMLFNVNLLDPIHRVTGQHGPNTPEVGAASNNIPEPAIVQDVPEAGPANNNIIPEPDIEQDANVQWDITKVLTHSDVDHQQNRLLVVKDKARHIIRYLDDKSRDNVEKGKAISITALDVDRNQLCDLKFNRFRSTQAYVINGCWHRDVVTPRELKVNDEIGLRWSEDKKQLVFSVLNKAPLNKAPDTP